MTATLTRPTFLRFEPDELRPAPRPMPRLCGCGALSPLGRRGRCVDCADDDIDLLTGAQQRRATLVRPSLLSVLPLAFAWLGGAALLCVPLVAFVPSVVASVPR